MKDMGQRIRQLEDAIAIFQMTVSNDTHPLLTPELLAIKQSPESSKTRLTASIANAPSIDAPGTLAVDPDGEASYIGRSGGIEVSNSSCKEATHSHFHRLYTAYVCTPNCIVPSSFIPIRRKQRTSFPVLAQRHPAI